MGLTGLTGSQHANHVGVVERWQERRCSMYVAQEGMVRGVGLGCCMHPHVCLGVCMSAGWVPVDLTQYENVSTSSEYQTLVEHWPTTLVHIGPGMHLNLSAGTCCDMHLPAGTCCDIHLPAGTKPTQNGMSASLCLTAEIGLPLRAHASMQSTRQQPHHADPHVTQCASCRPSWLHHAIHVIHVIHVMHVMHVIHVMHVMHRV